MKINIPLILLTLTVAFAVNVVSAAPGDMIYVNDSSGNDFNDGFSWEFAKKTIKSATGSVNSNGTVNIAKGYYKGVGNNNIIIHKNMTINGESKEGTIIDGTNNARIFIINDVNVIIYNLTIINGNATDSRGGAIYNDGFITLKECNFISNSAYLSGGAIFNNGVCIVDDGLFANNSVVINCGSAIFNKGTCIVNGSIFINNTSTVSGGAITNDYANCTVTGSIFTGNRASYGGAIYNYYGNCTLSSSTFTNNKASIDGGAFGNRHGNSAITGCNFENNTAANGGAISNYFGNSILCYSRIIGNNAAQGSAIFSSNGQVDARYNWWGLNSGPAIEKLVGEINYYPWLVLSIKTNPSSIREGKTATITADVYNDCAGGDHSNDWPLFFSDVSVKFTTNRGQIGSKEISVVMSFGKAIATLRASSGAGLYILTVTLDGQRVDKSLNVSQAKLYALNHTIKMQKTGLPINYLIFALFMVISGFLLPKRK
ncbi:MAG: hypothetical protein HZC47_00350 [Methanobacterium sp.]|uniref:hypothetical protein n=1 Tax=Methanobacterium sp. TaxID=2164 RepID=UPI003D654867|nr:hypothetical protein [Methanobacterium sp.]